jgi:hypothetical protein
VRDRLVVVVLEVVVLPTTTVLVRLVWIVDETMSVDIVLSVKATTKVTGKLGIENVQINPG